ncbi:MAG: hypothetical protein GVY24_05815 [Planctomycetes bacterium]|jgi:hypothetical protein|nr:hypothetical protein [Planctomycetota bacterium]
MSKNRYVVTVSIATLIACLAVSVVVLPFLRSNLQSKPEQAQYPSLPDRTSIDLTNPDNPFARVAVFSVGSHSVVDIGTIRIVIRDQLVNGRASAQLALSPPRINAEGYTTKLGDTVPQLYLHLTSAATTLAFGDYSFRIYIDRIQIDNQWFYYSSPSVITMEDSKIISVNSVASMRDE